MTNCLMCDHQAGYKYACDDCVNEMRRWLRELEDYTAIIVSMMGSIGPKPTGSIGVSFGSKPPMPLIPVAMLDPRSAAPDAEAMSARQPYVDTVRAVLLRDHGQCTWLSGHPRGGGHAYLSGQYDTARRCPARASRVDTVANPDEHDMDNLRSLCIPHRNWARSRRPIDDAADPTGWDEHDHVRSLPSSIRSIACWIREERDETNPVTWTLVSELRYLRGQIAGCALEQWVDDLHNDLRELHRTARQAARDVPRPLSGCLTVGCDGMVFWDYGEEHGKRVDQARCATCRRVYTGLDLVRLGATQEAG